MKKLWQKNNKKMNSIVEAFETKDDLVLDQKLLKYDVLGSLAHAKMLNKIGILTSKELNSLGKGLSRILELEKNGKFNLENGDEDIHTKIENYLTSNIGEAGEKIHTGRSRNDQVLTAIRLYLRNQLGIIETEAQNLIKEFKSFVKKYGLISMPGYTHMQKAMQSSLKIWGESFIDSLEDDLKILKTAYEVNNQSPLGSGAGYGVSLSLDRKLTANILNFKKVQQNPLYCQNSRGKIESIILSALIQILLTINKFASDVLIFTTSEFNFFTASDEVTSGSSIMPQKRNLDLAELLRSKVHVVLGNYAQIVSISSNLISGYNRDIQDTKKPLMESIDITLDSIKVAGILLTNLTPNKEILANALTEEIYATNKAFSLVKKGIPFRQAYRQIGLEIIKKRGSVR